MNSKQRELCKKLVKMESSQAANFLMEIYPINSYGYGEVFVLLPHRSWKRREQKMLARYYFKKLPFSSALVYESFASFMSARLLLFCVSERLPMSGKDVDLLSYYLVPVLKKFYSGDRDKILIEDFVTSLNLHVSG
ncbi:hypothetical protein [Halomonas denitrificans]|uniref:hypothetical protein n=1 Tax=Halomonas TaxID=2745 RepID=UPI001C99B64E|nr:hypothetical protein [Halomonas denitrificans]MBY5969576.1 hypothetical protein [Halomonas denitrificans]